MTARTRLAAAFSALTVLAVAGAVHAQFAPPTCVPPNCSPQVIQNIDVAGSPQTASINITGSTKLGSKLETGAQAPTFTAATDYLFFGNVNAASTAGYLLLLQTGGADRMKVNLAGQQQLPLGSAGAPSYSFLGDTNTGLFSSAGDSMSFVTNGIARTIINNNGTTVNSGVLTVPVGSAAAPSITFAGDTNTGIYRSAADTINIVTNGVSRIQADAAGAVSIPSTLSVAGGFSGDGSGLTNLNASNIATGTLNDARLSSNIPLLNGNQTFTGANTFSNAGNSFTGNGSGLTSLNASNISSGALPDARLSSNVALYNGTGSFTGANTFSNAGNSFTGNGAGLTSLNASNLSSGSLPDARLSSNVALYNANGSFTGANTFSNAGNSFTGNGAGLTSLNASNISSGTLGDARLSSNVALYNANGSYTGTNSYSGMTSYGSPALALGAAQNLIYGNVDTTSTGSLLLLQTESVDRFRVAANGNTTISGNLSFGGTLTGGSVPWARLTSFPAACPGGQYVSAVGGTLTCATPPIGMGGSGTTDYISKFTSANAVGNSLMFEDTANGRIGIGTTAPNRTFEVRNGDLGTFSGSIFASFGTVSAYVVAAGASAVTGQAVGIGTTGVAGVGEEYGVYGSGDYGGYFTGNDNFGGAGIYAEWTGTGVGYGIHGFTNRPAATAGRFEATDGTNVNTKGLYVSAPTSAGGKALWVAGDALVTNNISVTGNETIGGVATEAYNVITNYTQYTGQAGDAAAGAGRMGYNTSTGKFRCYEGGVWKNCTDGVISSVTASGAGVSVAPTTGAVVVSNTGVTSAGAGAGISVSGPTGAVTVTNTGDTNAADDITGLTAGAGISISGVAPTLTVTNTGDTNIADDFTGSGTANYLAKFTGSTALGNSQIFDNGVNVGIANAAPAYPLDVTGNLQVSGAIGSGGQAPVLGWGIKSSGSVYGVYGSGNNGGGYFTDADGTSYGVVGILNYGFYTPYDAYFGGEIAAGTTPDASAKVFAYGGSDAYAYLGKDSGTGNGKGIMAYGQYYGGYFRDTDSVATMYAAWGGYGTYGLGSTAGGYFSGTAGGAPVYVGYGSSYGLYVGSGDTYGVYAYGTSTAGRFYDSTPGEAVTFIAGAGYGVQIVTGDAIKPSGSSWQVSSDRRLKKDVSGFSDSLETLRKLQPVNFAYNGLGETKDGLKGIGFIAQDVMDTVPYMIRTRKAKLHPEDAEEIELYTIEDSALPYINLNAIKELDLRIEGFAAKIEKIDELDAKMQRLEDRVKELESEVEALKK